jgi:hypothetical protein
LTDSGCKTDCQSSQTRDDTDVEAKAEFPGNGTDVIAIGIADR